MSSLPTPAPPARPGDADALRARLHLIGLYALLGLTVSSWLARLPTVRADLDLTTGALGAVLLAGSIGSLGAVLAAGALATRWGSRRTLVVAAWLFAVASVLLGLGPTVGSVAVLAAGVVVMTASFAVGNVPLNVQAVVIERRLGRTVVPQFHAAFSVGAVAGSGLGALAAWMHLPLVAQFTAVAGLSLVWRLRSIPHAVLPEPSAGLPEPRAGLPEPSAPGPGGGSRPADPAARRRTGGLRQSLHAWQDRRTLALGLVIMAGALSEGTANTWVAIGVVDGFAVREAFGAVVFAAFVAGMTAARLAGTWLIDRHGSRRVLTVSAAASIGGLVGFSFSPSVPVALAAAAVWGLGSGLVVPIGMAAVTGDGVGAAGRVAVVSAFASVANLVAPPVTGLLAERVGVRHAVLAAVVVLAAGLVVGRRTLQESPGGGPMREDAAVTHRQAIPARAATSVGS